MIKLINEIKHLTGGFQYTTTSEARAVAEKCCQVACDAINEVRSNHIGNLKPDELTKMGLIAYQSWAECEDAIRKAFGGSNDE